MRILVRRENIIHRRADLRDQRDFVPGLFQHLALQRIDRRLAGIHPAAGQEPAAAGRDYRDQSGVVLDDSVCAGTIDVGNAVRYAPELVIFHCNVTLCAGRQQLGPVLLQHQSMLVQGRPVQFRDQRIQSGRQDHQVTGGSVDLVVRMRGPRRNVHGLAGADLDLTVRQLEGQCTLQHVPCFIVFEVHMHVGRSAAGPLVDPERVPRGMDLDLISRVEDAAHRDLFGMKLVIRGRISRQITSPGRNPCGWFRSPRSVRCHSR